MNRKDKIKKLILDMIKFGSASTDIALTVKEIQMVYKAIT